MGETCRVDGGARGGRAGRGRCCCGLKGVRRARWHARASTAGSLPSRGRAASERSTHKAGGLDDGDAGGRQAVDELHLDLCGHLETRSKEGSGALDGGCLTPCPGVVRNRRQPSMPRHRHLFAAPLSPHSAVRRAAPPPQWSRSPAAASPETPARGGEGQRCGGRGRPLVAGQRRAAAARNGGAHTDRSCTHRRSGGEAPQQAALQQLGGLQRSRQRLHSRARSCGRACRACAAPAGI